MTEEPRGIDHPATLPDDRLLAQCEQRFLKRSGPGGQHRNKVETAVQLLHRESGIAAEANERRSQRDNKLRALQRLRLALATNLRSVSEQARSAAWSARCRHGRLAIAREHSAFPGLLAEALDVLASRDFSTSRAAGHLRCTPSQLVKFCKKHPPAFQWLNAQRAARGLRPLK